MASDLGYQAAMTIRHQDRPMTRKRDQFAEHLANGLTPRQAAERMGGDTEYGNRMMQRIRKEMGWQAR